MGELKKCTYCKKYKTPSSQFFHKDNTGSFGYHSKCKICVSKIRAEKWAETKLNEIKHRSGSIKHEVTITVEYLHELYKKQNGLCYWLGVKLDTTRKDKFKAISVDRLDSSLGYIPENIVLSCRFVNLGRGNSNPKDTYNFIKELKP